MNNEKELYKKEMNHKGFYEKPMANIFLFTANDFIRTSGEDDYMIPILPDKFF